MARFDAVCLSTATRHVPFRLYCPPGRSSTSKPLLVWLHGLGEAGDNNRDQLAWLELLFENQPNQNPPCFVIALQRPAKAPRWLKAGSDEEHPLSILKEVIEDVVRHYPIDDDRIYLAGISSGASGCWELAKICPDRFAAVIPMASTAVDMSRLERLVGLPIWAFQSTGDGQVSIDQTVEVVRRIQRLGGRVHLSVVDQPSHDCWTSAFVEKDIGNWMLAQRRDAYLAPPPGRTVGQFKGIMLAVTALIALAAMRCRRLFGRWRTPRNMTNPPSLLR